MRVKDDAIEVVATRLSVELVHGAHGKPALARGFADPDLRFNKTFIKAPGRGLYHQGEESRKQKTKGLTQPTRLEMFPTLTWSIAILGGARLNKQARLLEAAGS